MRRILRKLAFWNRSPKFEFTTEMRIERLAFDVEDLEDEIFVLTNRQDTLFNWIWELEDRLRQREDDDYSAVHALTDDEWEQLEADADRMFDHPRYQY